MPSLRTSCLVGRIGGVDVRLHLSLLAMVAFLFYVFLSPAWLPKYWWEWTFQLMLVGGFFISILLHQAGHPLVARCCGLAATEVVLWPLGGLVTWSRAPEKLGHRLLVSAAGPLASGLTALVLSGAFWGQDVALVSLWSYLDPVWADQAYKAVFSLAVLTGMLAFITLLPVEPLAGGGMLSALLERFFSQRAADAVALVVGILCVIGLGILAFVAGGSEVLVFCVLIILGIVSFNPRSKRWLVLGTSVLAARLGIVQAHQGPGESAPAQPMTLEAPRRRGSHVLVGWGVFALVIVVGLGVAVTRGSAAAPILVLEHANLIDGVSDTPQRDVTVVVADGRISAVSPATFSPPAGATRVDLKGRWLLPGFIDAHGHAVNIGVSSVLGHGVTTCRSMFSPHYMDVALRDRHRAGDLDIPDILASGYPMVPDIGTFPIPFGMEGIYVDQPGLKDLGRGKNIGIAGVRRLVRANLDHHVDLIKVFATNRAWFPESDPRGRALSDEQLAAAVAEARTAGIPVAVHAYGDDGVAASVRAGVSTVEHGVYVADATLALMEERGVSFVPTIVAFAPPTPAETTSTEADALPARRRDMATAVRDSARRAHAMGLSVLAGTDGGGTIGEEIVELAGIGMTPMAAIQAATSRSAAVLGIAKRTGSIRQGLEADLVVLDGNPLDDIKAVTKVVLVVNNGRLVVNRLQAK